MEGANYSEYKKKVPESDFFGTECTFIKTNSHLCMGIHQGFFSGSGFGLIQVYHSETS